MASTGFSFWMELKANGSLIKAGDVFTATAPFNVGDSQFPALRAALTWAASAADLKANNVYAGKGTVPATGTFLDLDLSGPLVNPLGEAILLTSVKILIVAVVGADGVKKVRVGPGAVTNPFLGPWGGANPYLTVDNWCPVINHPWAGYPVVAGTGDKLRFESPGATLDVNLLVIGL